MTKQILLFSVFLCSFSVFSSDHIECFFEAKIDSVSGSAVSSKREKKMQSQKTSFEILKVSKASEENFCREMKKKKKYDAEVLFKNGQTLKAGKKVILKFEYTASEVVKNGKVADMVEYEAWYLID
ncbi:MAG TPA: hypothetical protein PL048_07895 [Leptospiraceae bacterium]|nr:hypothetical protein [Leptospiraceae bacterium]HMY65405.1 hypothetical protein [Leptospiraceae bacterium]HMZ58682.1 hypothetical protein [Leptospiraceae bacterium]HNF13136.1 hypothetical protein [Leptospiraceae bacterium]HNF23569.1 hypothetical protein [Leptospiraceae bacterium]